MRTPSEMRQKSVTNETEVQRLMRDIGFWQDQCGRLESQLSESRQHQAKLEASAQNVVLRLEESIKDRAGLEQQLSQAEARVKELRQLVIDDVPHRYQTRLLEAIDGIR